jgi:hypothetical protein
MSAVSVMPDTDTALRQYLGVNDGFAVGALRHSAAILCSRCQILTYADASWNADRVEPVCSNCADIENKYSDLPESLEYPYHLNLPWPPTITRWTPIEEYGDRRLVRVEPAVHLPLPVRFCGTVVGLFYDSQYAPEFPNKRIDGAAAYTPLPRPLLKDAINQILEQLYPDCEQPKFTIACGFDYRRLELILWNLQQTIKRRDERRCYGDYQELLEDIRPHEIHPLMPAAQQTQAEFVEKYPGVDDELGLLRDKLRKTRRFRTLAKPPIYHGESRPEGYEYVAVVAQNIPSQWNLWAEMIMPALPERDKKRVGVLAAYWKKIIDHSRFSREDLLGKGTAGEESRKKFVMRFPKFSRAANEIYQPMMEGLNFESKDTVEYLVEAMEKELNHICPTDVCPDNACVLDDSVDSIFTHAYYCADAETRSEVLRGGIFSIVTLDRPRIYRLAHLGASREAVAEAYARLAKDTKREAVHDAQKKANRVGLGTRGIKQARYDRAQTIYQAFRNVEFRSVEPMADGGAGTRYFVRKHGSRRLLVPVLKPTPKDSHK